MLRAAYTDAAAGIKTRPQCVGNQRWSSARAPAGHGSASTQATSPQGTDAVMFKRSVLLSGLVSGAVAAASFMPGPAMANGIASAIVDFWKTRQSQNGGIIYLAPIRVAQKRLQDAAGMLDNSDASAVAQALQTVRASSMNCYVFDALADDSIETKASLFTQELKLSDPCTFRLIVKNATVLAPADVRDAAYAQVDSLILSYQKLDSYLEMASEGSPDALAKARDQLQATLQGTYDIEATIRTVLGVAA